MKALFPAVCYTGIVNQKLYVLDYLHTQTEQIALIGYPSTNGVRGRKYTC